MQAVGAKVKLVLQWTIDPSAANRWRSGTIKADEAVLCRVGVYSNAEAKKIENKEANTRLSKWRKARLHRVEVGLAIGVGDRSDHAGDDRKTGQPAELAENEITRAGVDHAFDLRGRVVGRDIGESRRVADVDGNTGVADDRIVEGCRKIAEQR